MRVLPWMAGAIAIALTACGGGSGGGDGGGGGSGTPASSSASSFTSSVAASSVASSVASSGASSSVATSVASSASSSATSSSAASAFACPATGLYFCDDFAAGTTANWDLKPESSAADGTLSVVSDGGNNVLQYAAGSFGGLLAVVKASAFTGVPSADYYVEARIKPQTNSTTGNKQIILAARYVDKNNFYGGVLNVQNSTGSTQVEIGKMAAGSLGRPLQVKRPIVMDSQWYTLRYEVIGSVMKVYLDGELMTTGVNTTGTVTDTAFTAKGLIGLWTANKSFQIDDIKVGDPSVKPVQLNLNPAGTTWAAEAGDTARVVAVTAVKNDGTTPDTFTTVSSNPAVVSVSTAANNVTLTPLSAGTANITFTSGSDATVKRVITATISPQFIQPTTTYSLGGKVVPAAGDAAAYIDSNLQLTFDSTPTLGSAGSIRIFKKSDDSLVDVIKVAAETDSIGPGAGTSGANIRMVNTTPIRISGNTVTITPHNNKLAYGTEYYVAIANGVFTGANLSGTPFVGIGKTANWSFTTKADPGTALTTLSVDDNGTTANFRTVQGAINYVMKNVAAATAATINVSNGTYEELLFVRGKNKLTLTGESRNGVVIQYKNYDALNAGTGASQIAGSGSPAGGRAVLLIETADELTLDTLTLKNTMLRSTTLSSQAETLYFNNDTGRLIAKNANFYSEQDTIQVKGYSWFYNTLIEGNVDFIWGANRVALFENSEIRSVGDTAASTGGGYVLQARTATATDKGFVFLNSSLTSGVGPGGAAAPAAGTTYLARSAGGAGFDNVVFVNTKMGTHIATVGWAGLGVNGQPASNPATPTATSGWREYGTMDLAGNPLSLSGRVGGYLLSAGDVASGFSTRAQIFSNYGAGAGWNPAP